MEAPSRLPDSRNLQRAADQVYRYLFSEPLPADVKVRWRWDLKDAAGMATIGGIFGGGSIKLDYPFVCTRKHPLAILVHEFAHIRGHARHTPAFRRRVRSWLRKLSIPPRAERYG